jgi:threonine/homoserine/homoserine lactone efflux protein
MSLLFDGIKVGLILCFMIGPIFFALVQTGVEQGFRAGATVGLGIWLSDFLFITGVYWGVAYISRMAKWDNFSVTLGLGGSVILVLFGLGALLKNPSFKMYRLPYTQRTSSYFSLWLKGFLINSVNPFTVFFWLGLMSTVILKNKLHGSEAMLYFGGILGTVVLTDFIKVLSAKRIRQVLRPVHLLWFRRISGIALIAFGLALLARALWMNG